MNLQEYKSLLQSPENSTADQTAALQSVIRKYPFLQSAYALRLKGLYNENSYQYNHALKLAAAYTTDRTVLFDFITSEEFAKVSNPAIFEEESEVVSAKDEELVGGIQPREQSILNSIENAEVASEEFAVEDEISEEIEMPSIEQSILESIEISEQATEEIVFQNVLDQEFATEGNLAEAKEPQVDEIIETNSREFSVQEELGTPLKFSASETHSFKEWLQLSKIQPIIREEAIEEKKELSEVEIEKIKKTDLINRFIEASPKIPPVKSDTKIPVIRDNPADTSALMTETLARVYLEQKKYQKAIQAYQILILKYPEKSSFFADRISDIKNIQQNN